MVSPSGSRAYTRFIPKEEIEAGAVTQWSFGHIGSGSEPPLAEPQPEPEEVQEDLAPPAPLEPLEPMISLAEHEALLQQASAQAHAEGHAQGLAQGQQQTAQEWQQRLDDYVAGPGQQSAEQLTALLAALDASCTELQQRMARELLQLACDIARQVVRRELKGDPQALLPVVREALDMLVSEGRAATVRLHPSDWEQLERPLREKFGAGKVQWQPDPAVAPGDCLVESAGAVIDGSLPKRWRRAVAALGLVGEWEEGDDAD